MNKIQRYMHACDIDTRFFRAMIPYEKGEYTLAADTDAEIARLCVLLVECERWVNVPMQASDAAGLRDEIRAALSKAEAP